MDLRTDRRSMVLGAGLGLGALLLPAGRALAQGLAAQGFTHGVASGEPGADSMLLWTRYVPAKETDGVRLEAEVALDPDFTKPIPAGSVRTGRYRDWTAKVTVDGLKPGTFYWYRFVAPDGSKSPMGRTKTLPVGDVKRFGLAVFSCSNLPYGRFNAYAHAAGRDDLDLWLHVGDYIYENGNATLRPERTIGGRPLAPETEILAIADYRLRYACYRADPDLQRLHQQAPMVALWDDHESTNDSWEGGADNHQSDEGDWNLRRAAAMQVYREWMPVSDEPWKAYPIGTLATLYRTESRLLARTEPLDDMLKAAFQSTDPNALTAFRDGPWQDASLTMLGTTQESWLAHAFKANARSTAWQLVGMGTIIGRTFMPKEIINWLKPGTKDSTVTRYRNSLRAAALGLPLWMDRWDGYPQARTRLLRAAQEADADLVMLAGDSHNAWAYSLVEDGKPAGVEFAGQGVTSGGIEGDLGIDPRVAARGFVSANPELEWADTSRRGYMMLQVTPQRVTGDWLFLRTIRERDVTLSGTHRMHVERGRRVFAA